MEDQKPNSTHTQNIKIKLKLPKQELQVLAAAASASQSVKFKKEVQKHQDNDNYEDMEEEEVEEGEIRDDEEEEQEVVKKDDEEEEEQQEEEEAGGAGGGENGEVKGRICPHCNKGFSCGKALGGHMRIHTDPRINKSLFKQSKKMMASSGELSGAVILSSSPRSDQEYECSLCSKKFPSKKSLFGHMRSHPDRLWRGMNPPKGALQLKGTHQFQQQQQQEEEKEEEEEEEEARFSTSLSRLTWKVTGKRGRKACYSSPDTSSSSASFNHRGYISATDIILLSAARRIARDLEEEEEHKAKRTNKGKGVMVLDESKLDEDEIYYLKNMGYLPNYDPKEVRRSEGLIKTTPIKMFSPSNTMSKIKGVKNVVAGKISTNHNDVKKLKDLQSIENNNDSSTAQEEGWRCKTCHKTFATPQALGGHRSSHNKEKNHNIAMARSAGNVGGSGFGSGVTDVVDNVGGGASGSGSGSDSGSEEDVQDNVVVTADNTSVEAEPVVLHKCKFCDKTFTSGQALGGHQRCHYNVPVPEVSSSLADQSSSETGRRGNVLEFDLNAPYMEEEDGDLGDATVESNFNS